MKKRFLSLMMALCLVVAMVPGAFAADGLHQVGGVYQIEDAADLRAFAELVNSGTTAANAVLTGDVDLGGQTITPIGNEMYAYSGEFNGNNHAIMNGKIANAQGSFLSGLFGHVGKNGKVENIVFQNVHVTNSTNSGEETATGIAVGRLYGKISGITTDVSCTVEGNYRTGGIVGDMRGLGPVISNCTNRTKVTGHGSYTGGITGATHELGLFASAKVVAARISACNNYGEVQGTSEVGGIAGYADRAAIEHCNNYAAVTGTGNYGTGGILGCDIYNYGLIKPQKGSTITDCANSGTISAPRAGGILGSYVAAPGDSQPTNATIYSVLTRCSNSGAITGTAGKCGAIFGYQITYAQGDGASAVNNLQVKMVSCSNTGTVNGVEPSTLSPSPYIVIE